MVEDERYWGVRVAIGDVALGITWSKDGLWETDGFLLPCGVLCSGRGLTVVVLWLGVYVVWG